jgi:hypothetical protein
MSGKNYIYDDYDEYDEDEENEKYDVYENGDYLHQETAVSSDA